MEKNSFVYSHTFLGQVEFGTHGYGYVCLGHMPTPTEEEFLKKHINEANISNDSILKNNYSDDNNKESKDHMQFIKRLQKNIRK